LKYTEKVTFIKHINNVRIVTTIGTVLGYMNSV
jgi:hypothetical protein